MAVPTDISYTVDGTTVSSKTFAYGTIATFDGTTINDSDILKVYHEGSLLTLTTHYTVDSVTEDVIIDASFTLTIGDSVVIERETATDSAYVNFTNNTLVDADDLDLAVLQLLFAVQELKTDSDNSLQYDIVDDCWDGQGRRACNFISGTSSTDLTTLGQVQNLLAGTDTAAVDDIVRWSFTGDGTTTTYTLTSPPAGLDSASQVVVSVDGVLQLPTTNYTLSSGATTTITFTTAPASSTTIQVLTVQGIVSVTFPDGSIDGPAIADDAIGLDHLNVGVGAALRALIFDTSGDPTARTLVHTDVTDFDAGVQTNRLDQMAAPTGDLSIGTQKLTSVVAGSASTDGVNKGQMDAAIAAAIPSTVNKALGGSETISGVGGTASISLPGTAQMITFRHNPTLGGTTEETIFFSDLPYTIIPSANTTWTTIISSTGSGLSLVASPGSASGSVLFEYGIITD